MILYILSLEHNLFQQVLQKKRDKLFHDDVFKSFVLFAVSVTFILRFYCRARTLILVLINLSCPTLLKLWCVYIRNFVTFIIRTSTKERQNVVASYI